MYISDVLKRKGQEVERVEAAVPLSTAIRRFGRSKIRCLVVTENEKLAGVLTIRDALLHIDRHGREALDHAVRAAMTPNPQFVTPRAELEEAHSLFIAKGINHLPVVDDGELVGLVTPVDILASHLKDEQRYTERLTEYITGSHAALSS